MGLIRCFESGMYSPTRAEEARIEAGKLRQIRDCRQVCPGRPDAGRDQGDSSRQAGLAGKDAGRQPPVFGSGALAGSDRTAAAGSPVGIPQLEQRIRSLSTLGREGGFRRRFQGVARFVRNRGNLPGCFADVSIEIPARRLQAAARALTRSASRGTSGASATPKRLARWSRNGTPSLADDTGRLVP